MAAASSGTLWPTTLSVRLATNCPNSQAARTLSWPALIRLAYVVRSRVVVPASTARPDVMLTTLLLVMLLAPYLLDDPGRPHGWPGRTPGQAPAPRSRLPRYRWRGVRSTPAG